MKSESELDMSFDPRSWVGPEMGGTGAPSSSPAAPRQPGQRPRWAVATAASVVILLVGAALAWHQRSAAPAPAASSAATRTGAAG